MSPNPQPELSSDWQTHAEKTNYRETPNYEETVAYARKLASASPLIRYRSFGLSGEGRELPLMIASEGETFTPQSARSVGKAVVLVQACIHSGEPDGKDAGFALLRDVAISKTLPSLLDNVVLLFIPIYNADGHERSSPYNRINQNGPADMGWRATTVNQNLNRDYMKADTPETRAWLALWNEWTPDLFIDCHVTDGADYRYNITYHFEHHDGIAPSVLAWQRTVMDEKVLPATEATGNVVSWYLEFADNRDFGKGIRDFNGSPRFSTGYVPLRNRAAILIETHMIKDYRSRVIGTYDLLRFTLAEVNGDPTSLLSAIRAADERTTKPGVASSTVPITFELTDETIPYDLKALEFRTEHSDISGDTRVIFGNKPLDVTVPMYNTFRVTKEVTRPVYYIVPSQWKEAIAVLEAHGLELKATRETMTLDVESYRFSKVEWPGGPFEGRFMPKFQAELVRERRTFPTGSIIVPLDNHLAKLAINLLEPEAPDSLVAWGFFNAIFEQKEYGEAYVLENLAREMLSSNSGLREEFVRKLESDTAFASSPDRRLQFFYERSPYWDPYMNVYPVGRIMAALPGAQF
ncbi:MAG TPA: M14 family metallopeptidase [Pyrinomonadaceae bacterium]|nr:M14 family metallopeptidase [Pyrinomonadaceae bacterium]